MAKSNKNLFIGIGIAVVAIAAVIGIIVGLNSGKAGGGDGGDNGGKTSQTTGDLSASDLAIIDETVEFGDYDSMESLAKDIQNGYATGKVVKIEGIVAHPMSTYNVLQTSKDGSKSIGTQFIIEGVEEDAYPEDGDKVTITGKVVEKSALYFVIKTLPEFVVVE